MRLASRGQRDLDRGPESIESSAVRELVRRQARGVYVKALAATIVLTAVALLI
ncbi:MAG TPA: hypothetical protein VF046_08315 [Gemmatimonadales bacterium]